MILEKAIEKKVEVRSFFRCFHGTHHQKHQGSKRYPIVAAIDLGTNSCRLLMVRVNLAVAKAHLAGRSQIPYFWKVIDSYSKVVRLGEGLEKRSHLTDDAMQRALNALSACRRKLDRYAITHLQAVGTEACRRVDNAGELIERAEQESGVSLQVIDARREIELAFKGCAGVLDMTVPFGLIFDIGGGSTDIGWIAIDGKEQSLLRLSFRVIDSISLPFGVLTTDCSIVDPDSQHYDHACSAFSQQLYEQLHAFVQRNQIDRYLEQHRVQMIGTSGTIATLAALHLGLSRYDRRVVDGMSIRATDVLDTVDRIFHMSHRDKLAHPCIGSRSLNYMMIGSLILRAICRAFPTTQIRVADRGVREGILMDLVRQLVESASNS
jgi:exopolyphosphatase/guanosine-5'-triphosphate,3'-diphosphate pyrophosphatase